MKIKTASGPIEITPALIRQAVDDNRPATAAYFAERWLEIHSFDISVASHLADAFRQMNRFGSAIDRYRTALSKVNAGARWIIHSLMGSTYREWGRMPEAEASYCDAIEAKPDELGSRIMLGACLARQGKLAEAEASHRIAVEFSGNSILDEAFHNLGLVLRGQGRLAEAADCFRKALALMPADADVLEALEDAERIDSGDATNLSIAHALSANQTSTVARLAPRWLLEHPDDCSTTLHHAEALFLMARYDDALKIYNDALRRFADDRWAIQNQIGRMYEYRGRPSDAEHWFRESIELEPSEEFAYRALGGCLLRQGKFADAVEVHQAALAAIDRTWFGPAYGELGISLRSLGRYSEATECLLKAIDLQPNNAVATAALADLDFVIGIAGSADL